MGRDYTDDDRDFSEFLGNLPGMKAMLANHKPIQAAGDHVVNAAALNIPSAVDPEFRDRLHQQETDNPDASMAGNVFGNVSSALLTGAAGTAAKLGPIAKTIVDHGSGAVSSLMDSIARDEGSDEQLARLGTFVVSAATPTALRCVAKAPLSNMTANERAAQTSKVDADLAKTKAAKKAALAKMARSSEDAEAVSTYEDANKKREFFAENAGTKPSPGKNGSRYYKPDPSNDTLFVGKENPDGSITYDDVDNSQAEAARAAAEGRKAAHAEYTKRHPDGAKLSKADAVFAAQPKRTPREEVIKRKLAEAAVAKEKAQELAQQHDKASASRVPRIEAATQAALDSSPFAQLLKFATTDQGSYAPYLHRAPNVVHKKKEGKK